MKKNKRSQQDRTQQGDVMARQAFEAKRRAMQDGYGAPGARVWTQQNKRATANRKACRGKVAWS